MLRAEVGGDIGVDEQQLVSYINTASPPIPTRRGIVAHNTAGRNKGNAARI